MMDTANKTKKHAELSRLVLTPETEMVYDAKRKTACLIIPPQANQATVSSLQNFK
jgi:hypothetical protein